MLKRLAMCTIVGVSTIAGVAAVTAPATAAVNACAATATGTHARGYCTFVATSGTYHVDILSTSRYAWSEVTCDKGDYAFVSVWDVEGGYDSDSFVFHSGGICTLTVASGSPSPSNPTVPSSAYGTVRFVRP